MTGRAVALVAALALLGAAAVSVRGALARLERQQAVSRLCDAVQDEQWSRALSMSAGLPGSDPEGQVAAECRCYALMAVDRVDECVASLDDLLAEPEAAEWVPEPLLTRLVLRGRLEQGRHAEAATLARRATARHPHDLMLVQLEAIARSLVEGEEPVLADLEARIGSAPAASTPERLVAAAIHQRRGDAQEALRVLGDRPPEVTEGLLARWFEARTQALASLGRLEEVVQTYETWRQIGGDPVELRARYALRLSVSQLADPKRSWIELLRDALAEADALDNETLHEALYERLIGHLLVSGQAEEALRVYDQARTRFSLAAITREQIEHSTEAERAPDAPGGRSEGVLAFRLPPGSPSGTLLVSPEPHESPDRDYDRFVLAAGETRRVARVLGPWPQRWVFWDAQGRTRASGTAWPLAGREVAIEITPRPASEPEAFRAPSPGPADARRRVFVVVLDCADWRLAQYLRTRGELPVLDDLLGTGTRAVLDSFPPLTATAMESLVWPSRGRQISFLGLVHHLGVELAGLASVGRNPLSFLAAVLPEGENLFETVGAGDRVAANMLFSHGMIDAGRHAEIVGPYGQRRPARSIRAFRPLSSQERERFPALVGHPYPQFRPLLETIAAEFDSAVAMAREGEIDLLLIRIEPLDILTHALFSELTRTRQDDGDSSLLWVYRYVDHRLAELWNALDESDVLVVMSDHGIRTAMEHERDAIFVAVGAGLTEERVPGRPDLRGVPRTLAGLLSVEASASWPETGLASALLGETRTARAGRLSRARGTGSSRTP